jgi:hypothetical protein
MPGRRASMSAATASAGIGRAKWSPWPSWHRRFVGRSRGGRGLDALGRHRETELLGEAEDQFEVCPGRWPGSGRAAVLGPELNSRLAATAAGHRAPWPACARRTVAEFGASRRGRFCTARCRRHGGRSWAPWKPGSGRCHASACGRSRRSCSVGCCRTAPRACTATAAVTTTWWRSPARVAASARRVGRRAWWTPRRGCAMRWSRKCRCGDGCCRCRIEHARAREVLNGRCHRRLAAQRRAPPPAVRRR